MAWRRGTVNIVSRMVLPLMLVGLVQSVLMMGILAINGVFTQLEQNALTMLDERTQNKFLTLQTEMTLNWSYLSTTEETVLGIIEQNLLEQGKTFADIRSDAALNAILVASVAEELLPRMRENDTTGIFLVLDGIGVVGKPDTFAGIYLRDTDPLTDASDNSDIHILRALPPLTRKLGFSLDSFWQASFTFPGGVSNTDNAYFLMPLHAARRSVAVARRHDGYWSMPFSINGVDDGRVITYSEPLINREGQVYGVIGVEMNESYLVSVLNRGEFARESRGSYFLGVTTDRGMTYRKVITGGARYKQFFSAEEQVLTPIDKEHQSRITLRSTRMDEIVHGSIYPLEVYPLNTIFSTQEWVLIGLENETELFAFTNQVRWLFMVGAVLAAALSAAVSAMVGRSIVRPVVRLVGSLRASDPNQALALERTGITEVDALADALVTLNHDVRESAGRLSRVIRLSGIPLGVFEIREDSDLAFCSDGFFRILGQENPDRQDNLLPKAQCLALVSAAMADMVEATVYRLRIGGAERYVRIQRMQEQHAIVGTVMDVTDEMENRRRIEQERDHDLLTGLLNRRAFDSAAESLFISQGSQVGVAAVIMFDLDNLKFLNDTYGHDCGDGYIRAFADALRQFGTEHVLMARRSGDEFLVLLYGTGSKAELWERVRRAWKSIQRYKYILPDATAYQLRVSGGIAWYPEDARNLNQLIHFADFAMYKVKRSAKGTLETFNAQDYNEESFLISGRDALDRMIDQQLVRFAVQPILHAQTGDVYGYELLMRTNVRELPDPTTVLRLAAAEGKLARIERLTWMVGLEAIRTFVQNRATPPNAKFFLNSIANQSLLDDDERTIAELYGSLLPRLVIEVTEGERNNEECTRHKLDFVHRHGGEIAIDDYGTGYNSEMALMQINADIVKLDISFVHNVDTDPDKQALIQNLIRYARERGIAVLAEGVETREEMRTLIRFGVDYLQGYYLGAPQYQPMNPDKMLRREIRRIAGRADAGPDIPAP